MSTWQLQEAKAHFSEVIRKAETEGPQDVTVRGESKAVIISRKQYDKLTKKKKKISLVEFMRKSPLYGLDLNFERDRSPGSFTRDIDL